jgi:hypothetical protein
MCRYEIQFYGVSPELAAPVLFAAERTYREHIFTRDSENYDCMDSHRWRRRSPNWKQPLAVSNPNRSASSRRTSASLAASRRQLTEARENLRVIALRRFVTTAKLLVVRQPR